MRGINKIDLINMPLLAQQVRPVCKGDSVLNIPLIDGLMQQIPNWQVSLTYRSIERTFYQPYIELCALLQRVVLLAEQYNHHPKMTLEYSCLRVEYTTHSIQSLSINDLILAAKIDQIA